MKEFKIVYSGDQKEFSQEDKYVLVTFRDDELNDELAIQALFKAAFHALLKELHPPTGDKDE